MLQFNEAARPAWSPWGKPDHAEEIFAGVWSVSTPSHGGLYVTDQRRKAMDQSLLSLGFNGHTMSGWFEEDCDWCMVALAFPDEWTEWRGSADDLEIAKKTLENWILPKRGAQ